MKQEKTKPSSSWRPLYPFESHGMKINGFCCHYVDEGDGEPVIMVHGNPTWSFYFRELIAGLRSRYRMIAPDHIGCGLSDKPDETRYDYRLNRRIDDFGEFVERLGLTQKLTLVVHDWGGMIAMAYAVMHPEKIGRLVVTNTAAFLPPPNKQIPFRLKLVRNFRYLAGPAVLGLNLFARAAIHMASQKKLSEPVRQGLLAPYDSRKNRIATLKFVQDIPLMPSDPGYDIVSETDRRLHLLSKTPMLILWGAQDFVFDLDYLKQWQNRFPHADVKVFNNAGHYLLEDVPGEALEEIKNFLSTHPPSG